MKNQHTPGPWELGPVSYRRNEQERSITKYGARLFTLSNRADQPTAGEANARLIAAAPELLAALQDIVQAHEVKMGAGAVKLRIDLARAAIAKANRVLHAAGIDTELKPETYQDA